MVLISFGLFAPLIVKMLRLPTKPFIVLPIVAINFSYLYMMNKYSNFDQSFYEIDSLFNEENEQERMGILGECFPFFVNSIYYWKKKESEIPVQDYA